MEILNLKSHCGAFSWLPWSVYKLPHLSLQQVEHSLSGTFKHFLCNVANIWICNYVFFSDLFGPNADTVHHDIALLNFTIFSGLCLLRIILWVGVFGVGVVIVAPVGLGWTNWVTAEEEKRTVEHGGEQNMDCRSRRPQSTLILIYKGLCTVWR